MFHWLGQTVARRPGMTVLLWIVTAAALFAVRSRVIDRRVAEAGSFLPPGAEQRRAAALMAEAFPRLAAESQVAVVAFRREGLKEQDFAYLSNAAASVQRYSAAHGTGWNVLSPATGYLRRRLVSPEGRAALLVVNLPLFFISSAAAEATRTIESLVRVGQPPGLQVEFTGTAAVGRDYGQATEVGVHRTAWVTIISVLAILLLVYRSPVAAAVPIVGIGTCTLLALWTLDLIAVAGLPVSNLERMFTVVLLYGAGVDFAMFWLARYREELAVAGGADDPAAGRHAAGAVTGHVGPAIFASSATTILGLLSLATTNMIPTQNAGKVLGAALCWAPVAGVTLVPAIVRLVDKAIFWPARRWTSATGRSPVWSWLAGRVVRQPAAVLITGVLLLLPMAVRAGFLRFRFDGLSELPSGSSSARGASIVRDHFAPGALYPVTVLIRATRADADLLAMRRAGTQAAEVLLSVEGIEEVHELSHPLGTRDATATNRTGGFLGRILDPLTAEIAEPFFLSTGSRTIRLEFSLRHAPFSNEAMVAVARAREAVSRAVRLHAAGIGANAEILFFGPTPYIAEAKRYMDVDQWRVWIGATAVIWLVLVLLVRRVGLSLFMVAATLLIYGATLGITHEFFTRVMGTSGLDYKVKLFLFVIIVAVGQDYNIFLVTRLRQESERHGDVDGAQRAILSTGSVISNCGLIMAATLGSLWAGGLDLLRQLGFALALGILLDTFIVRPLLMPSFWLLARKRSLTKNKTCNEEQASSQ